MIEGNELVNAVIMLVVVGLICWLLWWLLSYCAVPEPFNKVGRVIIALFAVLAIINLLLGLTGHPIVRW